MSLFPNSKTNRCEKPSDCDTEGNTSFDSMRGNRPARGYNGEGSAARFFYCAKASRSEREGGLDDFKKSDRITPMAGRGQAGLKCKKCGHWKASGSPCVCPEPDFEQISFERPILHNAHPTVKPLTLMRYLIALVTPPDGVVLDPFLGSGSTLVAVKELGFSGRGIENDPEYFKIAEARIANAKVT